MYFSLCITAHLSFKTMKSIIQPALYLLLLTAYRFHIVVTGAQVCRELRDGVVTSHNSAAQVCQGGYMVNLQVFHS